MNRKSIMTIIVGAVLTACLALAQGTPQSAAPAEMQQVYSGTLVDSDCRTSDAAGKCELSATTRSFGLQAADGRYMKIDSADNPKVKEALEKAKVKTGTIKAVVTGKADGDMLKIASVQLD